MVDRIKIGGINYKVIEDDKIMIENSRLGEINHRNIEIKVTRHQDEEVKRLTLIHEAMHALLLYMGEYQKHDDEQFVERFANGLLMLVVDNPKLFNVG